MFFCGVDYSITSPCLCFYEYQADQEFNLKNCFFHFLTNKQKYNGLFDYRYCGTKIEAYKTQTQRFIQNADWAINKMKEYEALHVALEGYAFGAKGRVFDIAESTGILKFKMFEEKTKWFSVTPTEIKKFATGKGNASKDMMYEVFSEETSTNIADDLSPGIKLGNPVTDIVDSYYLCKYCVDHSFHKKTPVK